MFHQKKTKGLNIIIVGCSRVGLTLVEQLSAEGHDITIVDTDRSKVNEVTSLYDIMGVVGNGASFGVQLDAGIKEANLIIAVTESDELNLLCCTVARRVGNCAAIARVRNPEYGVEVEYLREKLGLEMIINPDLEASREMTRILCLPNALDITAFAHGQAELIKIKIPKGNPLDGITVADVGGKTESVLIVAVERDGHVFIPSGDFKIEAGDVLSFVTPRRQVKSFFKTIGFKTNQVNSIIIVGGGITGYYLAKQLLHVGIEVKIIDKDKKRCEELSMLLPKAVIINGDGTDEELLKEEGIEDVESFVPLTGSDEENILLTLYANNASDVEAKVITKINRMTYNSVISKLELGSIVYPKYITTEAIVAYVRAKSASRGNNIETLSHLYGQKVEAIEFRVNEESRVTNVPLMNLDLKDDLLISFINRHGTIIIPSGQDCIKAGDTVMIVTTQKGLVDLSDILE